MPAAEVNLNVDKVLSWIPSKIGGNAVWKLQAVWFMFVFHACIAALDSLTQPPSGSLH